MKNIMIVQGHPDPESYCYAIAEAYKRGAEKGAVVETVCTGELKFDPNLAFGYRNKTELEPCLRDAQEKILNADHIVLVFPVWWGAVPAVMKGFLDRILLPGFAFKKRPGSLWWDKYLKGRSARIISTMDQPTWYYRLFNKMPSTWAVKRLTLEFCGIKPVGVTHIGPIRNSSQAFRERWLRKIERMGEKMK